MINSNPFSILFGDITQKEIKRIKEENMIINSFVNENTTDKIYIITGVRGCGKTSLLSSISKEIRKNDKWITIDLNSKLDLLESLASKIYEKAKLHKLFLKKEFSFSFKGVSFSIEGDNQILTIETLLERMLAYLKSKDYKVLVTIDDVESNKYMKIFFKLFNL